MILSSENIILVGSILLFLSVVAGKTSCRFGVPILSLFLFIGMLAGIDGPGGIHFDNSQNTQFIGMVALVIILFSGGMDTKFSDIKPIAKQGILLATVGVLLTAVITGVFIYYLTNNLFETIALTFFESMLLASIMSSTDSASVFATLRSKGLGLKENMRPLLEMESGSNDPMAYMLMIVLMQLIKAETASASHIVGLFFYQLIVGALAGFLLSKLAVRVLNRINLNNSSLYPILLVAFSFFIFSITEFIGANGYLAVYLGGLVIGNSRFVHKRTSKNIFDGFAWLSQIIMFLTLGLLVNPSELLPIAGIGLLIGVFMILVSRPAAVMFSLLPFQKMSKRAKLLTSWVGLRGAVPIIFATYPLTAGLEHASTMFNIVFFITILSLLVQGTSIPFVARLLKLSDDSSSNNQLTEFDVEFSDEIKSVMTEITIEPSLLQHGNRLMEMPLPENLLIVLIKRKGHYFVPQGNTELHLGDVALVISDNPEILAEIYTALGIS